MAITVDASGQVVGLRVHDAVIIGLSYDDGNDLSLKVRTTDGRTRRVVLAGVTALGMTAYVSGSIIADVFAWKVNAVPTSQLEQPDGAWSVLLGGQIREADIPKAVEGLLKRKRAEHLVLIECSYGGSIAALCQSVEAIDAE